MLRKALYKYFQNETAGVSLCLVSLLSKGTRFAIKLNMLMHIPAGALYDTGHTEGHS